MLRFSDALAPLGQIAVQHRERLDGSGYPRGIAGAAISRPARILAAVDAYQAMHEPRPYRPPLASDHAAGQLRAEVKAGRLDAEAVDAVLAAAGHRVPRRREGPAGLTEREVEVLKLLARGRSNKEIAARLVISPKTVASHIEPHLLEDRRLEPGNCEPVRGPARPAARLGRVRPIGWLKIGRMPDVRGWGRL